MPTDRAISSGGVKRRKRWSSKRGSARTPPVMEAHARAADDRLAKYFPDEKFDRGAPVTQ